MATRQEFGVFMYRLAAAIPRFAPAVKDQAVLDAWFDELGKLDTATLTAIYKRAVAGCDQFPSIKQCLELVGLAPQSAVDKAREVAERIYGGIKRYGEITGETGKRRWTEEIAPYLGDIGVEVVRLGGGWNHLCEVVLDSDATTWKAQWRGTAEAVAKRGPDRSQLGPGWDGPALPPLREVEQLADRFDITPKLGAKK